jgi:5-methylcytosine-specific restriction endonuclease McrA
MVTMAERMHQLRTARRRLGLCIRCAQPAEDGATYCVTCRALDNANSRLQRRRRRMLGHQEGTCTKCCRPRVGLSVLCEWHYLQNRARLVLGSTSFAAAIKQKLIVQDSLCYYTGVPLVLGVNDSLDHVLSIAKHPESRADIDNVIWCTREINTMKNGMDADEFLMMCHLISSRWPS